MNAEHFFFAIFLLSVSVLAQDENKEKKKLGPKEIRKLLESQDEIKQKVRKYLKAEEKRLSEIKSLLDEPNIPVPEDGFSNPVTIFKLIKGFVRSEILNKMQEDNTEEVFKDLELPDYWDMEKAGLSVIKMADKKKLTPAQLADSASLTYEECFHIGRMAYGVQDYYHAAMWFQETWDRMMKDGGKDITPKDKVPVLDYLSFSLYQEGNIQRAYLLMQQLLELDPNHKRIKENVPFFEDEMKEKKLKIPKSEKDLPPVKFQSRQKKEL